ncbi:MAG TPA: DUF6527 family protein [Thermoanaerobaculia bacterium]|jgi:hypothetical protein|nr:DUF6527 family protein [Thermoanaerobaculia bacterium]
MAKAHRVNEKHVAFHCPGCKSAHMVRISMFDRPEAKTEDLAGWYFNGNFNVPEFSPSVLVTGTEMITDEERDIVMSGGTITPRPLRCHSFVTNGRIQFLGDCTHALAGQTVDLPDWQVADVC